MNTLASSLRICAGVLLVAAPAWPAEITGIIRLNGCQVNPTEIKLRAQPLSVRVPGRQPINTPGEGTGVARIEKARDGSMSFTIAGLAYGQAYGLSADIVSNSCGAKVVWQAPSRGLVTPSPKPILLEGFAIRTRVEVMSASTGRNPSSQWVGAAHMDFFDKDSAMRRVRVFTDVPNVRSVVLQVSRKQFLTQGKGAEGACQVDANQPGLVGTFVGRVSRTGWVDLGPVDFQKILGTDTPPPIDEPPGRVRWRLARELKLGAPVYVRAIPVMSDAAGRAVRGCDPAQLGLPGWLILAHTGALATPTPEIPFPTATRVRIWFAEYNPPVFYPWPDWTKNEVCYRVVRSHDLDLCHAGIVDCSTGEYTFPSDYYGFLAWLTTSAQYGDTLPPGFQFCYAPGGKGTLDVLVEAFDQFVTGVMDALGFLVNELANLWEQIQNAVVAAMVEVLSALPVGCSDENKAWCEGLVQTGLTVALVSMGIPPALPNFDKLKEMGVGYAAAMIAQEAGVPGAEPVLEKAYDYAEAGLSYLMDHQGDANGDKLPDWLVPDLGLEPAYMRVGLYQQKGTLPEDLTNNFYWHMPGDEIFSALSVELPRDFAKVSGYPVIAAVGVLQANPAYIPSGSFSNPYLEAAWKKSNWGYKVKHSCADVSMMPIKGTDLTSPTYFDWSEFKNLSVPAASPATWDPAPAQGLLCKVGPF